MANLSSWLKLIWRLCILAILCASVAHLWADSKAVADSGTICYQCDQNNANGQSNCIYQRDTCISQCHSNPSPPPNCITNCETSYDTCRNNTWNGYDNCLYGFTNYTGLCSIVSQPGYPPPSGRGRTPCDNACRDQMLECRQNGGETCGQEFNDCKLSCG
jgi:hypothetical protein